MNLSPAMLDTAAAARYLGLSAKTLEMMRCRGTNLDSTPLRFAKLGRRVVYRIADLDAWVIANLRSSTSADAAPPVAA